MSAHNSDGSEPSQNVQDNEALPLQNGAFQPLLANTNSALVNPGTDSADDRYPSPVPMYPYGYEGNPEPLFTLNPTTKG